VDAFDQFMGSNECLKQSQKIKDTLVQCESRMVGTAQTQTQMTSVVDLFETIATGLQQLGEM